MKKALSVLLALCLLAGALPLGALPLGASASDVHSGSCGPNAKYTFSGDTLTISGTGATYDYWSKPTLSGWNDPAPYWVYSPLIKHIVIEEGITSLGDNSFQWGDDYVKLVSVQFPESLEEIGEKAFAKTPLTEIHLPKGIKRIGDWAFEETKISTIQVTRAIYGQGIFRNCENLKTITFLDEGTGFWYPDFRQCNGLTSVTIPGYVNTVQSFQSCQNLETVVMEEGVEAIPQGAFWGCKNLREVRMPETSLKSIGKYAFYMCSKLKTFVIPRSDPTLSNDVFWTSSQLRNVIVPKEIEYVYGNVFSGCDKLWNIYEESAEHSFIHVDYAFPYGDRKFAMIMNGDRGARHYSFDIEAFGFPSGLTDREPGDASATPTPKPTPSPSPKPSPSPTPKPSASPSTNSGKCGDNAFWSLDGSGTLTISGAGAMYDYDTEYEKRSPWVRESDRKISKVVIEPGITRIGDYAFSNLGSVTSISIPGSVTSMGTGIFTSCHSLGSIIIPSSVTEMGTGSFQSCWNLKEAKIYAAISELPAYTFVFCEKLQTVYLSESIMDLAENSFSNCYELRRVYTYAPDWGEIYIHELADYNINHPEKPRAFSKAIKTTATGVPDDDPGLGYVPPTASPSPSPDPVPDNAVTIVYEAGEGSGYMAPQTVESGKRYTVAECGFTPPAGKVFHRWGRKDSSLVYDPGETPIAAVAPGSTITYVAQWKEATSADPTPEPDPEGRVTVLYVPIEGWGDMDSQLVEPGTRYTIAECAYNPPIGKVFDCWVEVPSGQTWYPGETPLAPDTPGAYVIYHAQWKEDAGTTPSISFVDVKEDSWFAGAVVWAVENGITSGKGSSATFKPNDTCTRAEIMTFIWASEGRPSASSAAAFSDMPSLEAFRNAISWAVEKGITGGVGGNKFGSIAPCTRAQAVTFLWAAAGRPQPASMASFTDMTGNSAYDTAISWAVENSVTSGAGNNSFHPNKRCTRAEIVTFLQAASNARF